MPRRVEISVEAGLTEPLVERISGLDGLIGLRVQPGISRKPAGDVVTVEVTNRGLPALMRLLAEAGVGSTPAGSFSTSMPSSVVSSTSAEEIATDVSESPWEEIEGVIATNSNMSTNAMGVMAIAGVLATVGIATNALHVVLAAMLIAPGFQPIVRIALGMVAKGDAWRRGLKHTAQGYLALAGGAAAAALFLRAIGTSPLGSEASYLPAGVLISYWTTLTLPALLVTAVGGIAGALLVAADRAVLTAGVMVALALVPGAAIAALAAVSGEFTLAGKGALRWGIEAAVVLLASLAVLGWKQRSVHRRSTLS